MRYVFQKEKDVRRQAVLKIKFHDDRMNFDEPLTYYQRRPTIWGVTCAITKKRIPWCTMAYKRYTDYLIRDEITTDFVWVSEAGYILEKLKGNIK